MLLIMLLGALPALCSPFTPNDYTSTNAQVALVRSLLSLDLNARNSAIETLSRIPIDEPGIVGMVAQLAQHSRIEVRRSAIIALGSMNGPNPSIRALTLLRALRDEDAEIRESAARSLEQMSARHCAAVFTNK